MIHKYTLLKHSFIIKNNSIQTDMQTHWHNTHWHKQTCTYTTIHTCTDIHITLNIEFILDCVSTNLDWLKFKTYITCIHAYMMHITHIPIPIVYYDVRIIKSCLYVHTCVCIDLCMCVHVCVHMCMYVCVRMCMCVHVCMHVCVYVCACTCA